MKTALSTAAFAMNLAMHANLVALANQLEDAQKRVIEARDAMQPSIQDRNHAVGIVLPLESILPECEAMLRAVLTLHSWRNRTPTEGGAV
jgi:hypothetical protein